MNKIESKIREAIRDAENCAADEVVENLKEVLKLLRLHKCRKNMEENGMEMYCGTCCPDCEKAGVRHDGAAQGHMMDHKRNWFAGTGIQPRRSVALENASLRGAGDVKPLNLKT